MDPDEGLPANEAASVRKPTRYGEISERTAAFAAADMLRNAEPALVLAKMGLFGGRRRLKWWERWLVKLGLMRDPRPPLTPPKMNVPEGVETVKFRRPAPFQPTPPKRRDPMPDIKAFEDDLRALINRHSLENESNTPDFILARHMAESYRSFVAASNRRGEWFVNSTGGGPGNGPSQAEHLPVEPAPPTAPDDGDPHLTEQQVDEAGEFVRDRPAIDTSSFETRENKVDGE